MKRQMRSCANWIVRNKWILIGVVLVTVFIFSNYVVGYKLSFSNVNYAFAPFDSTGTAIEGPLLSDIADNHYPTIFKAYYSEGEISLWESDIALGRPSDSIVQYMNPMKWVYIMPFGLAIFLKVFSEFAIGFVGMYLFMRSLAVKKYAAALSAVIYTFSAAIVVWLGWSHSDVAVWAPFLFFAIEKLIETLRVKYMFLIALVVYIMLIVGMPTYAAYFMYMAGLYIVIFTIKRHWHQKRNIFIIGGMFAVGVILAVVVSLPYTISLLGDVVGNGYMDSRTAYGEVQLDWSYIRTLLFPYERDGLNMHINESTLYVGVLAVVLLPFALCNFKAKKRPFFFAISTVILFLLIFTDVLNVVFTKIPMINTSIKFRVIVLLMFAMSALTGITLNDFLVNKEYYRKKPWLIAVGLVWIVGALLLIGKDIVVPQTKLVFGMGVFMVVLAGCVLLLVKKNYKLVCALLAVLVVFDSASFVRDYLPWIDADAEIIPEPTDSVEYMMENTTNEERIVGLGGWTLFPNTPTYYDLNDIRTHGFEATNVDMHTYYTAIDDRVYASNTRLAFQSIDNYELLKYLGVKYIYGKMGSVFVPIGNNATNSKVYGPVASNSRLYQTIELKDNPQIISILFATYNNLPQSGSEMTVSLISEDTGETVFQTNIPVAHIQDNAKLYVPLNSETPISQGVYTLELSFGELESDTLTVWMKEQDGSIVSGSNGDISGALAAWAYYLSEDTQLAYQGEDRLIIAEMTEYADKVELAEKLVVCATDEKVLDAMMQEYVDNTAFIVGEDASTSYNRPLQNGEGVVSLEYEDDRVVIHCRNMQERYLILNDYWDEDWKAYVNGEEVTVEKVNYLMRGVKIGVGDDIVVEFRYEPQTLYVTLGLSAAVVLITMLLLVFQHKVQALVDAMKAKEDSNA